MKLINLRVNNVGTLAGELTLPDFADGLTVIHGPNETGKTTLIAALRAVLFEKHSSKNARVEQLQTWHTDAPPEAWLTFEHQGIRHELHKRFIRQEASELTIHDRPPREQSGSKADAYLRDLLETQDPGRARDVDDKLGIWPFLWPAQGQLSQPEAGSLPDACQRRLRDALTEIVGEITGGPQSEALLDAARQECRRYYQSNGTTERGELKAARRQAEEAREQLAVIDKELARSRILADELANVQAELARDEEQLRTARQQRDEAARTRDELRKLRDRIEAARREETAAEQRYAHLRERRDLRQSRLEEQQQRTDNLTELQTQRDDARRALETAEQQRQPLTERRQALREKLHTAEQTCARIETHRALLQLQAERNRYQQILDDAETLQARIDELATNGPALTITAEQVEALQHRAALIRTQRATLAAQWPRLIVRARQRLTLSRPDGSTRDLAEGESATEPLEPEQQLRLGDWADLSLQPGDTDLTERREELIQLERQQQQALAAIGVATVDEAHQQWRQADRQRAQRDELRAELRGRAPEGIDEVRAHVQRLDRQWQIQSKDMHPQDTAIAPETLAETLAEADRQRQQHHEALEDHARQLESAEHRVQEQQRLVRDQDQAIKLRREELDRLNDQIEDDRQRFGSDEALELALREAFEAFERARETHQQHRQRWDELDAETIEDDARRTQQVVDQLTARVQQNQRQRDELRGQVRQAGTQGWYEQRAEAEAHARWAEQSLRRIEREAHAARCLDQTLRDARAEAHQRFNEPLRQAMTPLLRILLPEADVSIDEDLHLDGLSRNHTDEPIAALSAGMREQLAIVARLAMGRLLRRDDERIPIVLDDAMVATDTPRFTRMIRILREAAGDLQIILLTCHPQRYAELGAEASIDLAALKRQALIAAADRAESTA